MDPLNTILLKVNSLFSHLRTKITKSRSYITTRCNTRYYRRGCNEATFQNQRRAANLLALVIMGSRLLFPFILPMGMDVPLGRHYI